MLRENDVFLCQGAHFDFENPDMFTIVQFIDNTYNIPHWDIKGKVARTNLPACTYMRGPGKSQPHTTVCLVGSCTFLCVILCTRKVLRYLKALNSL